MTLTVGLVRAVAALSAAVLIAVVSVGALSDGAAGTKHVIEIREFEFTARDRTVSPGDTVVWVNRDIVSHTATARDGSWDSGEIEPGARWEMVVRASTVPDYFCAYHPSMTSRLRVAKP